MTRPPLPSSLLLCSLLALLAVPACGPEKTFQPVGPGTIEDRVWRNGDLGLQLTFPDGWSIQDDAQKKRLMDAGAEVVSGDDEQLSAEIAAGTKRTINLFSVFERPVGSTLTFNPSIIGIAENLRLAPEVQTPEDYFREAKKLLARSPVEVEYPRAPDTQPLGGQEFSVLYASLKPGAETAQQRYFARRFDDHMVLVIASHATDEQKAAIDAALATLTFVAPEGEQPK
jgi:hypothetical protein